MNNCLIDDRRIKVGHASAFCMCRVTEDPLAVQCSRLVAASMWRAPWQLGLLVESNALLCMPAQ